MRHCEVGHDSISQEFYDLGLFYQPFKSIVAELDCMLYDFENFPTTFIFLYIFLVGPGEHSKETLKHPILNHPNIAPKKHRKSFLNFPPFLPPSPSLPLPPSLPLWIFILALYFLSHVDSEGMETVD